MAGVCTPVVERRFAELWRTPPVRSPRRGACYARAAAWHSRCACAARVLRVEDYLAYAAGLFALVLRGLSGADRAALGAQLEAEFAPVAVDGGCALPGLALNAAAS